MPINIKAKPKCAILVTFFLLENAIKNEATLKKNIDISSAEAVEELAAKKNVQIAEKIIVTIKVILYFALCDCNEEGRALRKKNLKSFPTKCDKIKKHKNGKSKIAKILL